MARKKTGEIEKPPENERLQWEINRLNKQLQESEGMVEEYRLKLLAAENQATANKHGQWHFDQLKVKYDDLRRRYDQLSAAVSDQPVFSEADAETPKNYRGWTTQQRGWNKHGKPIYNIVRHRDGRQVWKYIGVWSEAKADQVIASA